MPEQGLNGVNTKSLSVGEQMVQVLQHIEFMSKIIRKA